MPFDTYTVLVLASLSARERSCMLQHGNGKAGAIRAGEAVWRTYPDVDGLECVVLNASIRRISNPSRDTRFGREYL